MKNKSLLQKFGLAGFAFFLLKGLVWLAIGGVALLGFTSKNDSTMQLKVSVYDTYVPQKQGGVMHFDILVDANEKDLEKITATAGNTCTRKGRMGNR